MTFLHHFRNHARAVYELVRGHYAFRGITPAVTVFGSARFHADHPVYAAAEELGAALARAGYTVVSGAGPGVMEAVSRGAKRAGGKTVGANIIIPSEQRSNPYMDVTVTFTDFWSRKTMLIEHSDAFIVMPGGFGTLDELTDVLNLMQSGKMSPRPVILVDRDFWEGFVQFCRRTLLPRGVISNESVERILCVDSPTDAVKLLQTGLTSGRDQLLPDHDGQKNPIHREAQIAEAPEHVE